MAILTNRITKLKDIEISSWETIKITCQWIIISKII